MRAVLQRVKDASVTIDGEVKGKCSNGFLILLGVKAGDSEKEADFLAKKIANLRVFTDENDKMNLSLLDIKGETLVISNFTLYADCRKGRRPSFEMAASPEEARYYYERFVELAKNDGFKTENGKFQAHMSVMLNNEGPVTIMLDSKKTF